MRNLRFQSICNEMRSGPDQGLETPRLKWIGRSPGDVTAAKPQNRNHRAAKRSIHLLTLD